MHAGILGHLPYTRHTPSSLSPSGERPCAPLTVAPVDATPPARSARASRDQTQREGCCLPSILGSKATVTARPGPAPLKADQEEGRALGAHPAPRPRGYLGLIARGCLVVLLGEVGE